MAEFQTIQAKPLIMGRATGEVLFSDVPLSFWGGIDPETGVVIDRHHPLCGACVAGKVLVLPSGRGSCTGSAVMLQLLSSATAPAAIVICEKEEIITLGVMIAEKFFGKSIPVVRVSAENFENLRDLKHASIEGSLICEGDNFPNTSDAGEAAGGTTLNLSDSDRRMLAGECGEAARLAMEVIVTMAEVYDAESLIDISQSHIDGCIYTGEAGLAFAERLASLGGKVKVPTTLNAISVDRRMWRSLGVKPEFGDASERLADAYLAMGAQPTYTCAPYLLSSKPAADDQIAWGESNAVIYANSVLGARTIKYPDYLDICIAITGRAPLAGPHTDEGRRPQIIIEVERVDGIDDAFFPLLGYHTGMICGSRIPLITGFENKKATADDLKAFSAAFGTTSAASMFHISGVTAKPPSDSMNLPHVPVSKSDLAETWRVLNRSKHQQIDLIALGNPHFSITEFERLAALCAGTKKHDAVQVIVTCGRDVQEEARAHGTLAKLQDFGVTILTDTCWCMIERPIIPANCKSIGTNSGKYVHYGPGLADIGVCFGSLADCVNAATTGLWPERVPAWVV